MGMFNLRYIYFYLITLSICASVIYTQSSSNQSSLNSNIGQSGIKEFATGTTNSSTQSAIFESKSSGETQKIITKKMEGEYELIISPIQLKILKKNFVIKGCNIHVFDAIYGEKQTIKFINLVSTKNTCTIDFDSFYLEAFTFGRFIIRIEGGYRILDQNSKLLLEILQQNPGNFLVGLPRVPLIIDQYSFFFEGCNLHSVQYKIEQSSIEFGQVTSTKKKCLFYDYDQLIIKSIQIIKQFQFTQKALLLKSIEGIAAYAIYHSINLEGDKLAIIVQGILGSTNNTSPPLPPISSNSTSTLNKSQGSIIIVTPPKNATYSINTNLPFLIKIPQIPEKPVVVSTRISDPVSPNDDQLKTKSKIMFRGVQPTSLKGTYRFESELQPILMIIQDQYIQFQSCNIHKIPYAAFTDGVFVMLQGGSSTKRQCILNNDQKYKETLRSINKFEKTDIGYRFLRNGIELAQMNLKIRNQIVLYSIINGGYSIDIPGLDISILDAQMVVKGCNTHVASYKLLSTGDIQIGQFKSSKIACQRDFDESFLRALRNSKKINKFNQTISFIDNKGNQVIKLVSTSSNQNYLNGQYKGKIPNLGLKLKISDGIFTLSGCNQFNFKFSLADNGVIIFGNPSSTNITCPINNDFLFLASILKSQSIGLFGKSILFYSGNNQQLVRAINYDQIQTNLNFVLDPKSPIIKASEVNLLEGIYNLNLLRTSLKALTTTIKGRQMLVQGCNNYTFSYSATSLKTIKVSLLSSSGTINCTDFYDKYFIDGLLIAKRFEQAKGLYTFYDASGKSIASLVYNINLEKVFIKPVFNPNLNQNIVIKSNIAIISLKNSSVLTETKEPIKDQKQKILDPQTNETFIGLKGKYRLSIPNINLQFIDNSVVFRGCNTHRLPYQARDQTISFGEPVSTNRKCINSNDDRLILGLLSETYTFRKQNGTYTFYNSKLRSLFTSTIVNAKGNIQNNIPDKDPPRNQQKIAIGSHQTQIPKLDLSIDDNSVILKGCKFGGILYKVEENGKIEFVDSKNKLCPVEYNDYIQDTIKSGTKIRKIDKGFELIDAEGNNKIKLLTLPNT